MAIHSYSLFSVCLAIALLFAEAPGVQAQSPPPAPPTSKHHDAGYEFVRWDRRPIKLHLKTGAERLIWFPGNVQPGVPPALAQIVRVQANGDTVYFKPHQSFSETRFPVRDRTSGRIYLLDVMASDAGSAEPVRVLLNNEPIQGLAGDGFETGPFTSAPINNARRDYSFVELTRFAAKQFYAPERLTERLPGVFRTSLDTTPTMALVRGADVQATPLASWRAPNGLVVTAVRMTNLRAETSTWDPRRLRGAWLTAAAQHGLLGPNGAASDTTVVYLISELPFREAAAPWLSK